MRFQASWLLEVIMDNVKDSSSEAKWFFPCFYQFNTLEWISQMNMTFHINTPVHSQAVLAKSWFQKEEAFPDEKLLNAFNQVVAKPVDIKINTFKGWLDKYFSKEQLDCIYYWRQSATEQSNEKQRQAFLAIVSQVMDYWYANNMAGIESAYKPDEILSYYFKRYHNFREHNSNFVVTERPLENLEPEECSTMIFNLAFNEDDYLEDESALIYDAWIHGHTDLDEARKNYKLALQDYCIDISANPDFGFFKRVSELAKSVAFCWSGKGIAPNIYQRKLVEPLQKLYKNSFSHSRLFYKSVEYITDTYDYILLFY